MKLLLDENISDKIIPRIIDLYSNSTHVKTLGFNNTDDGVIWEYAKTNNFVILSKDSDFHQRSFLYDHPPKFISVLAIAQHPKLFQSCGIILTVKPLSIKCKLA